MSKEKSRLNRYFIIKKDHSSEKKMLYDPPLLAESRNIRVELRKEKKHARPHVHIIKKGKNKFHDLSVALDNLDILAGDENLKFFAKEEFEAVVDFLIENQLHLIKIYNSLKGNL